MSFSIDTSPENLAKLIKNGIASNLEDLIKAELTKHTDVIISQLARELADSIAVKVASYKDYSQFDDKTQVLLQFNSDKVQYVAEK